MTGSSQFPGHGFFVYRVDIEIESQVGDGTFREMEIESEADDAFLGLYAEIEAFEFVHGGFDEFSMGIRCADTRISFTAMRELTI